MKKILLSNAIERTMDCVCYFIIGKDLSEEVTFEMRFMRGKATTVYEKLVEEHCQNVSSKCKDSEIEPACPVEGTRRLVWLECEWWL